MAENLLHDVVSLLERLYFVPDQIDLFVDHRHFLLDRRPNLHADLVRSLLRKRHTLRWRRRRRREENSVCYLLQGRWYSREWRDVGKGEAGCWQRGKWGSGEVKTKERESGEKGGYGFMEIEAGTY